MCFTLSHADYVCDSSLSFVCTICSSYYTLSMAYCVLYCTRLRAVRALRLVQ